MSKKMKDLFAPGHRACAGCGAAILMRHILDVSGENTIIAQTTGCMEVTTTPYPQTSWKVPWIHTTFENAASVASGIHAALESMGNSETNVIAMGGDGGMIDIGFRALSGALERGHPVTYIVYDNECYANTGAQRSGSTPYGSSTSTSPSGKQSIGKTQWKKDAATIAAAHHIPYVATASLGYIQDFRMKLKKALETKPSFLQVYSPCTTTWGYDPATTIDLAKSVVDTGLWAMFEIENGDICAKKHTKIPKPRKPVEEYLKTQKRFRHLKEEDYKFIQGKVDEYWSKYE